MSKAQEWGELLAAASAARDKLAVANAESRWSVVRELTIAVQDADARIMYYALNERELIAHALRLEEACTNPSFELRQVLSRAFTATPMRYEEGLDQYDEERALLAALLEAVK